MFEHNTAMDWQHDWTLPPIAEKPHKVPEWRLRVRYEYIHKPNGQGKHRPPPYRPLHEELGQDVPAPLADPVVARPKVTPILGKHPCDSHGPEISFRTTHVPGSWPVMAVRAGSQADASTASTARKVKEFLKKQRTRAKRAATVCTNVAHDVHSFTQRRAIPAAMGMKKRIVETSKEASTHMVDWGRKAAAEFQRAMVAPQKPKRRRQRPSQPCVFVNVRKGSALETIVAARPVTKKWLGTAATATAAAAAGSKTYAGISKRKRAKSGILEYFYRSDDPSTSRSQRRAKRSILRKDSERTKVAKKTATFYASPNTGGPVSTVRRFTLPPSSDAAETSEPSSSPMRECRSIYETSSGLDLAVHQLAISSTVPPASAIGTHPTDHPAESSSTKAETQQSLRTKRRRTMPHGNDALDNGSEDEVDLINTDSGTSPKAAVPSHAMDGAPSSPAPPTPSSNTSAESISQNPLRDFPRTDIFNIDDLPPLSDDEEQGHDEPTPRRRSRRVVFDEALKSVPIPQPKAAVAFPDETHVTSAAIRKHISSSSPYAIPKPSVYTRRRSRRILIDSLSKAAASPAKMGLTEGMSPLKRLRLGSSERRNVTRHEQEQNALNDSLARLQLVSEETVAIEKEEARLAKEKAEADEKERLAEIERERRAYRIAPSYPVIAPLSQEWRERLASAMAQPQSKPLATAPDGTKILRRDFGTLYPQKDSNDSQIGWLNDEIINTSMQHVITYALRATNHKRGTTPKFHAFPSQFFQNLSTRGVQSVARWAKRAKIGGADLLNVDYVFIPCNPGVHWTVMVVMPTRRLVEYFDSMHGGAEYYLDLAHEWLSAELGDAFKESEWKFREGIGPTQRNSQDCGVFLVTTSKMVMLGIDPEKAYSEKDLKLQRQRIACEIMNGGFTDDFAPLEVGEPALKMTNGSRPATRSGIHET